MIKTARRKKAMKFILCAISIISLLSTAASSSEEAFEPSGKIIFHSYSSYEASDSKLKIYDYSSDDMLNIESPNFYNAMNGDFGATDSDIVFMAINKEADKWDIFRYNTISNSFTNLTYDGHYRSEDPKFSPDGYSVVFKQGYWSNEFDSFIYNLAEIDLMTGKISMLTDDISEESMPCYSADGKTVYFAKGVGADSGIYSLNKETKEISEIYDRKGIQEYYPITNADLFYFSGWISENNRNDGIFRVNNNEILPMPFNNADFNCSDPFPIDDKRLFISSTQKGNYDIYLYDGEKLNEQSKLNTDTHELGTSYFSKNDAKKISTQASDYILEKNQQCNNADADGNGEIDIFDLIHLR
ncbi:MAG: hypothetical protein E7499_00370 [Ruminococcus sp.]|nr:hypothetical protein [Ruminococcus sp.]